MKKHLKNHLDLSKVDAPPSPVSTEADLHNTFVSILDGHEEFILSIEGKIIGSNLEAVNLTGYEEWEVIGKSFTLFYLPEEKTDKLYLEHLRKAEVYGKAVYEGCIYFGEIQMIFKVFFHKVLFAIALFVNSKCPWRTNGLQDEHQRHHT